MGDGNAVLDKSEADCKAIIFRFIRAVHMQIVVSYRGRLHQ